MRRDIDLINEAYNAVRRGKRLNEQFDDEEQVSQYSSGQVKIVDEYAFNQLLYDMQDDGGVDADEFFDLWVRCVGGESDFSLQDAIDAFGDAAGMVLEYDDGSNMVNLVDYAE